MRPNPLFVGPTTEHTRDETIQAYAASIGAEVVRGEYDNTPVIGGVKCYVTLVSNGDGTWSFAVFEDGPYFRV